jgi:hypothetical protein
LTQIPNPYGSSPATIAAVEHLPPDQVNLLNAVAAVNPNTVAVLNTTNPVVMPWLGSVRSVLEMWYSGSEGGTATARLLLGLTNLSGHSSMTWPANPTDTIWAYNETKLLPNDPQDSLGPHLERLAGGDAGFSNPTVESEGIYTGYRFFDQEGITPQFPFGFGLSYTHFAFSNLSVKPASDGGLNASFRVQNTGSVPGDEEAQVYLGPPSDQPVGIQFAVRALAQFDRVSLAPGQAQDLALHVAPRQLSYWSTTAQKWVLDPGGRTVFVGDADALSNLPLQTTVTTSGKGNVACADEQFNASTINGNLTVPQGDWCDLVDVAVNGNLQLHQASGVRIVSSTISGNLESDNAAAAADPRSSGANVVCRSTIGGNVEIHNSAASSPWNLGSCGGNSIGGNLDFHNNAATGNVISGNMIKGNLDCHSNGGVTGSKNTAAELMGQCATLG